jgi:hypothetical protein
LLLLWRERNEKTGKRLRRYESIKRKEERGEDRAKKKEIAR